MDNKDKDYFKKVNIDKAKNKTIICIVLMSISLLTYLIPLAFGDFDFGIIFEILTLASILIARIFMSKYDEDNAKRLIIFAMIPIGWLLIYDLITIISCSSNVFDLTFLGINFLFQELTTILSLVILYLIIKDLRKADNPEKYKESTDWFYENKK